MQTSSSTRTSKQLLQTPDVLVSANPDSAALAEAAAQLDAILGENKPP